MVRVRVEVWKGGGCWKGDGSALHLEVEVKKLVRNEHEQGRVSAFLGMTMVNWSSLGGMFVGERVLSKLELHLPLGVSAPPLAADTLPHVVCKKVHPAGVSL